MRGWIILDKENQSIVATSENGEDWAFVDERFKSEFETLLIEGIARGRKNYVPGDDKFDELFWEEVDSLGYEVTLEAEPQVETVVNRSDMEDIMPKALVSKLPAEAKKIYEEAYDSALETYDGDEAKAAMVAITAVKNAGYKKDEETDEWKKEKMQAVSMHFTKASLDPSTGEMRWSATVSKFGEDDQGDEVTPEFYKSAVTVIERGLRPQPVLCISHVDKGAPNDNWVAGDTIEMFIDGDLPKAKGTFRDTEIGRAAFEAVRTDIKNEVPHEKRARISMGFYDEGSIPKAQGAGRKFLQGWVKHFAVTRVPVVKETELAVEVEKSEAVTTIKEDAASIIGDKLAEQLLSTGENPTQDKSLVVKQTREDQVEGLIAQLLEALSEGPEVGNLDVAALRRTLGNRGTNVAPAEEAEKAEFKGQVETLVGAFADHVKGTLLGSGDRTEKFTAIQQGLDQFGQGVERLVKGSTPPSGQDISETVRSAVEAAVAPLQHELIELRARVEAGNAAQPAIVPPQPRAMDSRVKVDPGSGRPPVRKARTAAELAWASTAELPRY